MKQRVDITPALCFQSTLQAGKIEKDVRADAGCYWSTSADWVVARMYPLPRKCLLRPAPEITLKLACAEVTPLRFRMNPSTSMLCRSSAGRPSQHGSLHPLRIGQRDLRLNLRHQLHLLLVVLLDVRHALLRFGRGLFQVHGRYRPGWP